MSNAVEFLSNEPNRVPRYDLNSNEVGQMVDAFFTETNLVSGDSRFVGVIVDGQEPISDIGRTLEREVFEQTFEGNDSEFMKSAYEGVEEKSNFLLVIDKEEKRAAGVIRVVNEPPFVTLEHAPDYIGYTKEEILEYHDIQPDDRIQDVATLAIHPDYRSKLMDGVAISAMLFRMMIKQGERANIDHLLAMIDSRANRVMANLGIVFKPLHDHDRSFEYWGSPKTQALYGSFKKLIAGVVSVHDNYRRSEKDRAANNRLDLGKVAGMIATGDGIDADLHVLLKK